MSDIDITIDWHKPSPTMIGLRGKPATFARSRLYDLIDGMISQAEKTGGAAVTIRLALNSETGTENSLSANAQDEVAHRPE